MAPSVLIIGASGSLGRPLVEEFQRQKSRFNRVAILSDPDKGYKFADVNKNEIEVVMGSFLDSNSYKGFDVVLSLAGNSVMRLQPAMIEAAIAGGVRHFYPSEFGTDISQDGVWQFRYFRDKVAKEHPDFRYTLMLVCSFSEWAYSSFNGVDLQNHTIEAYGHPDAETSVTALSDVIRYTVESIFLPFPPGKSGRAIRVRGDHLTWKQLIALLEEVQGAGRTIGSSGKVTVPGPLDNDKFEFTPETLKETMQQLFKGN
ncbi:hypothetical protein B0H10DRAFT_2168683 [Mycena sp. CBHHK59/15]|nr:hypothetical protein B0H10DRAFT_2168683 [Mycena sp. CBHHK59/15]